MLEHSQEESAIKIAQEQHDMIRALPSWLSLNIGLDKSGRLRVEKTSWQFPKDKYQFALNQIAQLLEQEISPAVTPLPQAKEEE